MSQTEQPNGDRVRQLREGRGWSQNGLAKKAAVDVQTLRRIERGGPVRRRSLRGVARALGLSMADLLAPRSGELLATQLQTSALADCGEVNLLAGISLAPTLPVRAFAVERSLSLPAGRAQAQAKDLLHGTAAGPGRWIVLGEPGAGKTTLLRQLAVAVANHGGEALSPVFVRLAEVGPRADEQRVETLFSAHGAEDRRELTELAASGQLLLLLDGLDEVVPAQREQVRGLLRIAAATWASPMVVTSRPHGLRRPGGFEVAWLNPLSDAQVAEFLDRWARRSGPPSPHRDSPDPLDAWLGVGPELREIMRNPLLLTFVALLAERRGLGGDRAWPETRYALYDQVLNLLLEGVHRAESSPRVSDPVVVQEALGLLATRLTAAGQVAAAKPTLVEWLREHEVAERIARVPRWSEGPVAFLQEVAERSGVLAEHDGHNTHWRFWHRGLQELLAAKALQRQLRVDPEPVLDRARRLDRAGDEAHWTEPFVLACGDAPDPDALILALLEADQELAVRALEHAPQAEVTTIRTLAARLSGDDDDRPRARSFVEAMRHWWSAVGDDARPGLVTVIEYLLGGWVGADARARAALKGLTTALGRRHVDPLEVDEAMEHLALTLPSFRGPLRGAVFLQLGRLLRPGAAVDLVLELWEATLAQGRPLAEDLFFLDEVLRRLARQQPALSAVRREVYARLATPAADLIDWRAVPAGAFAMGTPAGQGGFPWEAPQRQVRFASGWRAAATPVTNAQFAAFDPAFRPADAGAGWGALPATSVSWFGAVAFTRWLSLDEAEVRLPTEAEWEYMTRAGTATAYWSGAQVEDLARVGWFRGNAEAAQPVGQKPANAWGLHDVHGNVWEWTLDWYGPYEPDPRPDPRGPSYGSCRILRGGSYDWDAPWARSAHRSWLPPETQVANAGFRPVRTDDAG